MILKEARIRGAIGVKKGLGLDEIHIDFRNAGPGLVGIFGDNGYGKSVVLDNLQPFRTMVSRPGALQDHFFLKDSFRDLTFDLGGREVRALIQIDPTTKRGKNTPYLYVDGEAITDGKTSSYDEAVARFLGNQTTFFNTNFRGQDSKPFSKMTSAEAKDALLEIIEAQEYENFEAIARTNLQTEQTDLTKVRAIIEQSKAAAEQEREARQAIEQAETELVRIAGDIEKAEAAIAAAETQDRLKESKLKDRAVLDAKIGDVDAKYTGIIARALAAKTGVDKDLGRTLEKIRQKAKRKEDVQRIAGNDEKIEAELAAAAQRAARLEELSRLRQERDRAQAALEVARTEYVSADRDANQILAALDRVRKTADLCDRVPCSGHEWNATCPLLEDANAQKATAPAVEDDLKKAQEVLDQKKAAGKTKARIFDAADADFDDQEYHSLGNAVRQDQGLDAGFRRDLADAQNADQILADLDRELKDLAAERSELEQRRTDLDAEQAKANQDRAAELGDARDRLDAIDREIEAIGYVDLRTLRDRLAALGEDRYQYGQRKAAAQQRLEAAEAAAAELADLATREAGLIRSIAEWSFVKAFASKEGFPALELSDAGAEITTIANDLLLNSIGEDMTIDFRTTRQTKEGKTREEFNVSVYNGDDETPLPMFCGGEKTQIDTAIDLSLGIFRRRASRRKIDTMFLDEVDSKLSVGNAMKFFDMLQRAHDVSGVYHTFIISHKPDVQDATLQRVDLTPGISEYVV